MVYIEQTIKYRIVNPGDLENQGLELIDHDLHFSGDEPMPDEEILKRAAYQVVNGREKVFGTPGE
jgi:hypothetical protein